MTKTANYQKQLKNSFKVLVLRVDKMTKLENGSCSNSRAIPVALDEFNDVLRGTMQITLTIFTAKKV